jgi:AcrR family transcriptional regulator
VPGKRKGHLPATRPRGRPRSQTGAAITEGLRAHHKRDKRERLRAAAWYLFTTVGYAETTTRAIAERAGIATGTLFLYARDKTDLLFLVFEERLREAVEDGFRTLPADATMNEQVLHLFERLFAMYGESASVARQFVKELPGADGPNADRVNGLTLAFLQRVAGIVERAQERGEVRKSALPLLVAQTIFAVYYMSLMTWLTGFNSLETALDPLLRSTMDLLMEGLAARSSGD